MNLSVKDRAIHVVDSGSGAPPVILVHSSTLTSAQWARYVPRLAPRRVLAPDLLGYGRSAAWPDRDAFALAEDVAIVAALLAETGGAHLVGHSYGGLLALLAAKDAPALVRSLVVYEPVAFGVLRSVKHADGLANLQTDDFFLDGATGGDERWMRAFIGYWNGDGAYDALPPARRAPILAAGRKTFLEVRALLLDETPADAYRPIACPTLLLAGTRSPVAGRAVCEVLAETLPDARLELCEGSGHMGPVVELDRVGGRIIDWLAGADRV